MLYECTTDTSRDWTIIFFFLKNYKIVLLHKLNPFHFRLNDCHCTTHTHTHNVYNIIRSSWKILYEALIDMKQSHNHIWFVEKHFKCMLHIYDLKILNYNNNTMFWNNEYKKKKKPINFYAVLCWLAQSYQPNTGNKWVYSFRWSLQPYELVNHINYDRTAWLLQLY